MVEEQGPVNTLHDIRKIGDTSYELDIEWGPHHVREWYRFDLDDGIIVSRMPPEFNHLHGWLLRPILAAFAAYLRGDPMMALPLALHSADDG
jgi:hypothetical protein